MTAKGLQIPRQFKLKQTFFVYTSVTLTYGMVPSATLDYSSLPSSFKLNVSKPSFIVDVNLTNLNFFIQFQLQTTVYSGKETFKELHDLSSFLKVSDKLGDCRRQHYQWASLPCEVLTEYFRKMPLLL